MAHFARIGNDNIVLEVIKAEQEAIDSGLFGDPSRYIKTSYNTRGGVHYDPETNSPSSDQSKALRKNFAGIGFFYDKNKDAFISPQPYPSWVLNEDSCLWFAPVNYPIDDPMGSYIWNEETLSWDSI